MIQKKPLIQSSIKTFHLLSFTEFRESLQKSKVNEDIPETADFNLTP